MSKSSDSPNAPPPSQFSYVQGDGRNLPYTNNEFDIVFSNSVIEHVGTFEDQKRFAEEIRRVAKSYWVQTPNRHFPVETHLIAPFIHFLPRNFQKTSDSVVDSVGLGDTAHASSD